LPEKIFSGGQAETNQSVMVESEDIFCFESLIKVACKFGFAFRFCRLDRKAKEGVPVFLKNSSYIALCYHLACDKSTFMWMKRYSQGRLNDS